MAKGAKTGGRAKGVPNKATAAVKEALLTAFDKLGGIASLTEWAKDNQTDFYKLWVKVLPQEVHAEHSGKDGTPIKFTMQIGDDADRD
jgi:hypothetical protein